MLTEEFGRWENLLRCQAVWSLVADHVFSVALLFAKGQISLPSIPKYWMNGTHAPVLITDKCVRDMTYHHRPARSARHCMFRAIDFSWYLDSGWQGPARTVAEGQALRREAILVFDARRGEFCLHRAW